MLIRKPTWSDKIKASGLVFADDNDRADFIAEWIRHESSEGFFSFVSIEKKKVTGFISGTIREHHDESIIDLGLWYNKDEKTKEELWKKIQRLNPDVVLFSTSSPNEVDKYLTPLITQMIWKKEETEEPENVENPVEETEETIEGNDS